MSSLILEDARQYFFPLFLVESHEDGVYINSRIFLGTAFFVSKQGDAVTANHILPSPDNLPTGKKLVAVVQCGAEQKVCLITHAAPFEQFDIALVHVNLNETAYLSISDQIILPGTDVSLIGVPSHEVWLSGKEMRILKGHVSLVAKHLELNIPIPLGMSGSPVFVGSQVVAFAAKSVKSEEIEDYSEEIELLSNNREQIRISKVTRVTQYGLAHPFSELRDFTWPIFDGKSFVEFIKARNE